MNISYQLQCPVCHALYEEEDQSFRLGCDGDHEPALLEAVHHAESFNIHSELPGLFRYRDWLPIRRTLPQASKTVVFKSEALANALGLDNLHIAFNGYWPERGATMDTCSFKELEAPPVLARLPESETGSMVVASAGNTGRAFLQIASQNQMAVTVVVPEFALPAMWITVPKGENVRLIALRDADYLDVIQFAGELTKQEGFYPEGGAKNIARRAGMGTVVLAAAEEIGVLPSHYFQAVGSGTGAIAAWEMSKRLIADGRFGNEGMKLHLAQNEPFTIMTDAWEIGSRELAQEDPAEAKRKALAIHAPVLSNRKPPYAVAGGVFDALADTDGIMYAIPTECAKAAGNLFEELEGCDLDPAAEVALAALLQAIDSGNVQPEECVLLNLTGGGYRKIEASGRKQTVAPDLVLNLGDPLPPTLG